MKKISLILFLFVFLCKPAFSQEDQFNQLKESDVTQFAQPFVTSLGTGLNSGGFYTASIPSVWGFSLSLRGMYIMIPQDQLTFTPTNLPSGYNASEPTATFWGDKGATYPGANGYITYPNGFNQKSVPFFIPQITASFLGTEVLIRYLPKISVGNRDLNYFGIGLRHSISQYIPLIPVDAAVQILYNKLSISDLATAKTLAINGEVSKTFGLFTAYGGLQYENSSFDLSYTLKGDPNSGDPALRNNKNISASITGKDHFRVIVGGSVQLGFLVINADYNLGSQSVLSGGLSFQF